MKKFFTAVLVAALVPLIGCEAKSPPGGPGARSTTERGGTATRTVEGRSAETFTLSAPATATALKQGESKEVTIAIDRGDQFKQDVTLKFNAPQGLKIEPAEAAIKASDKEAKLMVTAEKDAPLGEHKITVTAVPQTGTSTTATFQIEVQKGGNNQ